MAMNVRFIFDNLLLAGSNLTMTPTPEATLPVDNLLLSRRSRVVRTQSLADHSITGDLADLKLITSIALWRHNFSETATWRVRFWDEFGQTGNLVYDSGDDVVVTPKAYGDLLWGIDPYGATVFSTGQTAKYANLFFDAIFARSYQIDISDASNPDGYMEIDRLVIGQHFEPVVNMSFGMSIEYVDDSTQTRTEGNSVHVDALEPYRRLKLDLNWISDSEKTKLLENIRKAGLRSDVFISAFPEAGGETERDHGFVGKIKGSTPAFVHNRHENHTFNGLVIEES